MDDVLFALLSLLVGDYSVYAKKERENAKRPKGLKLRLWAGTRKDFHEYKWTFMLMMYT